MATMNAIDLSLFVSRMESICIEMGVVLRRTAFSPNIKDRLDFSCALFDAQGGLCAQAAHIPVHLGSMAFAMTDLVNRFEWQEGDTVILNDPFMGGTHLPDVTLITPVFVHDALQGFVVNRAHHANIGSDTPGSMPNSSTLEEEGLVIPPRHIVAAGRVDDASCAALARALDLPAPKPGNLPGGDLAAQFSANRVGRDRLLALISRMGPAAHAQGLDELNRYGETLTRAALEVMPRGTWHYTDVMDDDGQGTRDIPISVALTLDGSSMQVDFTGTAPQVKGNINCPLAVTAAGVFYVLRCLLPDHTPACGGIFSPVNLSAPEGSLVNARAPAAVAAGNVETSMRIVDVVLGALQQAMPERIPASSQGTMNNVAMGARARDGQPRWDYYETLAGGMGADAGGRGLSAAHSHMTNTLNTPVESLELHYPLRVRRYAIRDDSGGGGLHAGGDGLVREYEFLQDTEVSLLTERRRHGPPGLAGGESGKPGMNLLNGKVLPGKTAIRVHAGDRLTLETPGGGGYGQQ
jgi:N-methylhydantoinase B